MVFDGVIRAAAPTRICDLGGWTDTWFARHGTVVNLAVEPLVHVDVDVRPRRGADPWVTLSVENFGERYELQHGAPLPARHPMLEAAIEEMAINEDQAVEVAVHSAAPPAASMGTSASVAVALIGALDALSPGRMTADEIARLAHRVETERLGLQSGVQDQLAAAHGGISFIEVRYPSARVVPVTVTPTVWEELNRRLAVLSLGPHRSSEVHEVVIAALTGGGSASALDALRGAAGSSRDALLSGDLEAFGEALIANTAAQEALHPALISERARAVIDVARRHGATGWKVNGAGGEGGTLTLLAGPDVGAREAVVGAVRAAVPACRPVAVVLSQAGFRRRVVPRH